MAGTVEHDNNTIIIIHLPEEVAAEHLQAAKETKNLVKPEQTEEIIEDDKDKDKTILCALCNRAFRHNSSLKRHLQLHDESKAQSYECTICMKKLQYNSSLKRHMKLHSEDMKDKLYTCDICQKNFGYLTSLVRHRKLHSDSEKEVYSCDMCSKTFVYSSSLKRHILLHTEGKTFECPTCNKFFGYATSLARHVRLHSARQDFSCVFCKKTLRSEKSYMRHMSSCPKKHGVLDTIDIEIGQGKGEEDGEDNFFSDTVKSEEASQSTDEEDQVDDTKGGEMDTSGPVTMSSLDLGGQNAGGGTGDQSELTLATVAAQFENEAHKAYDKEARYLGIQSRLSMKAVASSDLESDAQTDDMKNHITVQGKDKVDGDEVSDSSNYQAIKTEMVPTMANIGTSEGEAARSLINIGISENIEGSVGNSIVISDIVNSNLQNLVNAAVVQSEQGFVTRPNLTTISDGQKGIPLIPADKTVLSNNGCTAESTASMDVGNELVQDSTDAVPTAPKSPMVEQEVPLANTSSGDDIVTADSGTYQLQVNGALPSGTTGDLKSTCVNTPLGHRFVATINGKEIELQLAAGSEIIQYVVPGDTEQAYIISQADTSNPDGTFLVQTNTTADQSASALSTALLGAVYLSTGDVAHQEDKATHGEGENVAVDTMDSATVTEAAAE